MPQKTLMSVMSHQLRDLHENHAETGMGFQFVETPLGIVAILEDGDALPCYDDSVHYDITDLIAGTPIPTTRDPVLLSGPLSVFPNRTAALTALQPSISPKFIGTSGAIPLIFSHVLPANTVFYRCLSSPVDLRYVAGQLTAGTYLTTSLDQTYANSGFATVGRYALPIPLPASHVLQYELPKGTAINVGTVAPMFGQAGGGVEVQLSTAQLATQVGSSVVADY